MSAGSDPPAAGGGSEALAALLEGAEIGGEDEEVKVLDEAAPEAPAAAPAAPTDRPRRNSLLNEEASEFLRSPGNMPEEEGPRRKLRRRSVISIDRHNAQAAHAAPPLLPDDLLEVLLEAEELAAGGGGPTGGGAREGRLSADGTQQPLGGGGVLQAIAQRRASAHPGGGRPGRGSVAALQSTPSMRYGRRASISAQLFSEVDEGTEEPEAEVKAAHTEAVINKRKSLAPGKMVKVPVTMPAGGGVERSAKSESMKDKRKKRHTRANSRKKVVPGRGSMGEEIRKLHGSLDSAMQSVRGYSMDNEAGMDDSGLPMKLLNFDGNYSHMGRGLQAGNKHQRRTGTSKARKDKWVASTSNKYMKIWRQVVSVLILYIAVFTPFLMSFKIKTTFFEVLDCIIDAAFLVDVVLQHFTERLSPDGRLLNTRDTIREYLHRSPLFWLDCLAALPVGFITLIMDLQGVSEGAQQVILPLRLVKLTRLLKVAGAMKEFTRYILSFVTPIKIGEGDFGQLLLMMTSLLLLSHWGGLFYHSLCDAKGFPQPLWIGDPFIDYTAPHKIIPRYLISLTWSMTALTGVGCSLNPTDTEEALLMLFMLVSGVFAYAFILGNVYSIVAGYGEDERNLRKHVDNILDYLKFRMVDDPVLLAKITSYYNKLWEMSRGKNQEELLTYLSQPLRLEVLHSLNRSILDEMPILKTLSNVQKSRLCDTLMEHFIQPGDPLIVSGEHVEWAYFVTQGSVAIYGENSMVQVPTGYILGIQEMVCLEQTFMYTAIALEPTVIVTVAADTIIEISRTNHELKDIFLQISAENLAGRRLSQLNSMRRASLQDLEEEEPWDPEDEGELPMHRYNFPRKRSHGGGARSSLVKI